MGIRNPSALSTAVTYRSMRPVLGLLARVCPAETRVAGMESIVFPSGSLGAMIRVTTPASIPWFLDPHTIPTGDTAPYSSLYFDAYPTS